MKELYDELLQRVEFLEGIDKTQQTVGRLKELNLMIVRVQQLLLPIVRLSLPTNDEILEQHNSLKTIKGDNLKHTKDKMHRLGYYRGAIWMRELIYNEA